MIKKCCLAKIDEMSYAYYEKEFEHHHHHTDDEDDEDDEDSETTEVLPSSYEEEEETLSALTEQICSCGCIVKLFNDLEDVLAEVWEKGKQNHSNFDVLERNSYLFFIERGFKEA